MMEEDDWVAAMEAEPENCLLMGLFADWLDERNDPRAGAFRVLWEGGKIGDLREGRMGGYWGEMSMRPLESRVSSSWFNATNEDLMGKFGNTVLERFVLARSWAIADEETRERWRLETLSVETANA